MGEEEAPMAKKKLRIAFVSEGILGASYQADHPSYHRFFPQRDLYMSRELSRWATVDRIPVDLRQGFHFTARQALAEADVLVFHNPEVGLVLKEAVGAPAIFDCVDWYEEIIDEEFEGDLVRLNRMAEAIRISCEIADAITCQSPVLLHWLVDRFLVSHKPLSIVPNGYDDLLFKPALEAERKSLRADLVREWPILACFQSWLVYQGKLGKWYSDLQSCLEEVEELKDTALICVGDGPMREVFEALGLTSTLFVGGIAAEKVPRFTRACDAAIFPVNDCSPIAVGEYLGCGLPVIAKGPRLGWLIGRNENGYLVDEEKGSWARGIKFAFEKWRSDEERGGIATRARGFTWQVQATKLLLVIEGLVRDR